jgi:hypothetical protein
MPYMKDFVHGRKVNLRHSLIRHTVDKATRIVNRDTLHRVSRCYERVRICVETKADTLNILYNSESSGYVMRYFLLE